MNYGKRSHSRRFKIGVKVLLLLPTSSSKLLSEWKGPYEVVRRRNKVDYVIRGGEQERTYHVNMLKVFRERLREPDLESVNLVQAQNCHIEDFSKVNFDINDELRTEDRKQVEELLRENVKSFDELR